MYTASASDQSETESGVFILPFALLLLVPMLIHMGMFAPMHRHTYACTERQTERERESVSRTCKFLSVCEAAAVVEVM